MFTGTLTGVTVVDTRPQGNGWTVTGQAAPFVNGATTIPAENVGWTLHADRSGQYAEGDIRPGPPVSPRLQSGDGSGLAQSAIFAFAASQFLQPPSGFGSQDLSADLHLWMPDTAPTGLYTSTLTLTLISP